MLAKAELKCRQSLFLPTLKNSLFFDSNFNVQLKNIIAVDIDNDGDNETL
ncbi:MAG: hypothetical protein JSS90_12335 [Bacteroidetes bacterium]|jgi:hypothetical protein|nr:hypothetical protein [Bacteroidota bacterium]